MLYATEMPALSCLALHNHTHPHPPIHPSTPAHPPIVSPAQAERVLKLQQLAAGAAGAGGAAKPLRWFIMTSPFTHADTV